MNASAPRISILMVNYNGLTHLEECLSSIYSQDFNDFEIVMVDNASKDASVEFVEKRFPFVKTIRSARNLGFAGGNNLGLPHCRGYYVFLLNNDTRLDQDALKALSEAIHLHPQVHVFACFLIDFKDQKRVDSAGDTIYTTGIPFSFTGFPVSHFTNERPVTSACAGAAAYSRTVLEKLKGFDEDFFLLFEDLDPHIRNGHGQSVVETNTTQGQRQTQCGHT